MNPGGGVSVWILLQVMESSGFEGDLNAITANVGIFNKMHSPFLNPTQRFRPCSGYNTSIDCGQALSGLFLSVCF